MSTGTSSTQVKSAKDVLFLSPDELVLDRDWNGRWTKVADESEPVDASAGKLPNDTQQQVSIRELAESIEGRGQLEDVLVCKRPASDDPDGANRIYHVVAGQSRTRAVAYLTKKDPSKDLKVRVRVLPGNIDDKEAFLINVEENKKRNNLTLLDKAYCMKRERDLGLTIDEISKHWSCSVPAVSQALSLIDLPEEVKEAVFDKVITASNAIDTLKGLTPEAQIEIVTMARKAVASGVPYKPGQIKELARQRIPAKPTTPDAQAPATDTTPATDSISPESVNGTGPTPAPASAPAPKKRGRPSGPGGGRVPRSLADLRKVLQGREGVLSQSINRYLDGYSDVDDEKLAEVLNTFEYEDVENIGLAPRSEGNDPDAAAFEEDYEPTNVNDET